MTYSEGSRYQTIQGVDTRPYPMMGNSPRRNQEAHSGWLNDSAMKTASELGDHDLYQQFKNMLTFKKRMTSSDDAVLEKFLFGATNG